MLNQMVLIGRIEKMRDHQIVLRVTRSYKNEDGLYDNDWFTIDLTDNIYDNVQSLCSLEDIIGIKGRLEGTEDKIKIAVEKVTVLSSKAKEN